MINVEAHYAARKLSDDKHDNATINNTSDDMRG